MFSADAIKHQHSKTKSAGEASPTPVETEETTTLKEHLLDPALNTDEVRDAAKQSWTHHGYGRVFSRD